MMDAGRQPARHPGTLSRRGVAGGRERSGIPEFFHRNFPALRRASVSYQQFRQEKKKFTFSFGLLSRPIRTLPDRTRKTKYEYKRESSFFFFWFLFEIIDRATEQMERAAGIYWHRVP